MTKDNLLTINVVTYNHGKYIAKCLDSLLSQKTNFGFIIRIFEDVSTDNTPEICQQYAEKYPDKIIYFTNKKNLGSTLNAKKSYQNITTKYYMFIEGDDYCCDDNKLQLQVDILEKNPQYVFCAHQTLCINVDDKIIGKTVDNKKYCFLKEGVLSFKDFYTKHIVLPLPHISSRIVRTECIKIPDKDPEIFLLDITQTFMLLEQGDMYFIDKVMTVYQLTGEGLATGASAAKRIKLLLKHALTYVEYSDGKADLIVYKTIANFINFMTSHIEEMKWPKTKNGRIKNYFMSPFLWDIFNFIKRSNNKISFLLQSKI